MGWRAAYKKITTRAADDWPTLSIALALQLEANVVKDARMVVGSAVNTPTRLTSAEAELKGKSISDAVLARVGEAAVNGVELMEDVHGSAAYKKVLLQVHAQRAIKVLVS